MLGGILEHGTRMEDFLDPGSPPPIGKISVCATAPRGLLATDHAILNHGQVTWTIPELAPPLLTTTPHQREDVSALDRFNVHRCPTRRVFSGTGLGTRDKASHDPIPIPLGYRGHLTLTEDCLTRSERVSKNSPQEMLIHGRFKTNCTSGTSSMFYGTSGKSSSYSNLLNDSEE
ncbi:uncharacterized protein TNCV_4073551 [Trichonephila clavipes]|uniref:Uncharacterized protein n=1 Tax=Trichonephila clavipes TaxID=2585209 RepID=A0A8X6W8P7_TRICX|nr:uncharacterized protein TNCV_4073551 [Trichonephila clavipes]